MGSPQRNKGTRKLEHCFHWNASYIREGKKNMMVAHALAEVFSQSLLHASETLKSILDILAVLADLGSYITGLTSSILGT